MTAPDVAQGSLSQVFDTWVKAMLELLPDGLASLFSESRLKRDTSSGPFDIQVELAMW